MNHSAGDTAAGTDQVASFVEETNILLVDASPRADQHASSLRREFDRVIAVKTMEEALANLTTEDIDCVISAYELPDEDGIELLEAVRVEYPQLAFVIWPQAGDETVASRAIAAGVTDYVPRSETESPEYTTFAQRVRTAVAKCRSQSTTADQDTTLQFFSDVCRGLTEAETTESTFQSVLEEVCEKSEWEYGEVWTPGTDRDHLTCGATYACDDRFDPFSEVTTSITFQPDEGLPGRVWSTGSEEFISDVSAVPAQWYLRTAAAEKAEFESAFGVPVPGEDADDAVLVVYATDARTVDDRAKQIVKTVAPLLGTCIDHHRDVTNRHERALKERTKELTTIHQTVDLFNTTDRAIDDLLHEFVDLLPFGFQYPETTAARLQCGDCEAVTDGFEHCERSLTTHTETQDGTPITLEVGYLEDHSPEDRGPFLLEEQELIDTLASIVKRYYERQKSIERLEESEARYRTLIDDVLETIDVGVWILDEEFTVVWANSAVADYFGVDRDTLIGADKRQVITEEISEKLENGERFEEKVLATYDNNTYTQQFECQVTSTEEREKRWLTHWSKPIESGLYEGGRIEHYTDITDRKERDQQLKRTFDLLQQTERIADVGGWEVDPDTMDVFWTDHIFELLEMDDQKDPSLEGALDFYLEEDRQRIEDAIHEALETGEPFDLEARIRTTAGELRWLHVRGVPKTKDGEVVMLCGAAQDITERKEQQKMLQRERDRFRRIFEEGFDAMILADDEGEFVEVNESTATLFGLPEDELIGRSIPEFAPEDFNFAEAWQEFQESGHERGTFPLVRPDGTERIVEYAASTNIVPGQHLSVLRDITDRTERQQELELFRALVDHSLDGFFVVDPHTSEILDVNEMACRQLGYERAELLSMSVPDINPEMTMDLWDEFVDGVRDQGEKTLEGQHQRKDGSTYPVEIRIAYVSLNRDYHVATVRDITDRKERECELKRQRELLRHTEELAQTGGWEADVETGVQRWTAGTRQIHDVSEDFEPTVETGIEFFHPEDRDRIEHVVTQCAESGEPYDVELRIITADDRLRWVRATGVPVRENGEITKIRGAIQDITARKKRERELEAARKRYETLIEAAPDPIFVADADTGEIVETNSAAVALREERRDEIIGLHQTELHPAKDADRYRAEFERHIEQETKITEFDDGSPLYVVTADGEEIPVAISVGTVSLDDQTLIHGIFRDISEQRRYEESLVGVNRTARDMAQADTDTEIAHLVVDTATELLESSGCAVYLYDDHVCELTPAAYTDGLETILGDLPRFSPGEGVAWQVFAEQESARFDNVQNSDAVYNPGTPIRSELLVPLGEHGVFIVGDTDVASLDDLTVEIAEALAATAEAALDRAARTQELHEQQRKFQQQTQQLERVQRLNEEIRTILKAIVQAGTRESIKQIVCDALQSLDQFECVWIGEPNLATDEVSIEARAGTSDQYLDAITLTLESENTVPAVRAVQERKTVVETNIAGQPHQDEWRQTALLHEFRSVMSVPLVHEDVLYGALTVYSCQLECFDELTEAVLTELGELIGYALNTLNQRNALLGDGAVDLTFTLSGVDDVFVEMATQLSSTVQIENISSRSEETFLVHFTVEGVEPDQVRAVAEDSPAVKEVQLLSDESPPVFEIISIGKCIATEIAELGATPQTVSVSERGCECRVSVPQTQSIQTFVRYLEDRYSDVELKAQQHTTPDRSLSKTELVSESLTARQRDILTTAYYSGYFEDPRQRTGSDIADSFGISQSAVSKQLRVAQQKLLTAILE